MTFATGIGCALVVTAHPDDSEYLFGATIAALVNAGTRVDCFVCSDGAQGGDADCSDEELIAVRRGEQLAAARVLGVTAVTFAGFRDGWLQPTHDLRRAIAAEIRRRRPSLVVTHYPRRALHLPIEASHPDHMAVGEATLRAAYPDSGNAHAFPDLLRQGLSPHTVGEVWVAGYERPDHAVNAGPFLEQKMAAILCHRSQLPAYDRDAPPAWVQESMRQAGRRSGLAYAEDFKRISLDPAVDLAGSFATWEKTQGLLAGTFVGREDRAVGGP